MAACGRGERVLYISFEDTLEGIAANMRSLGLNIQKEVVARKLEVFAAMPESFGVEEHLWRISKPLNHFGRSI